MSMLLSTIIQKQVLKSQSQLLRYGVTATKTHLNQKKSTYDFKQVENEWVDYWSKNVSFTPNIKDKTTYSVILPPANITGYLHLGHALTIAIQDTLVRYHRMNGENVSFIPGLDHAGIATQAVLEKRLQKEGKTRQSLGRKAMETELYKWSQEYQQIIQGQIKGLGAYLDWDNKYFTLDKELSDFVIKTFIDLYNQNMIYRGNKILYYSPFLQSVISDIEVDWLTVDKPQSYKLPSGSSVDLGYSYVIQYNTDDNRVIYVSTTRPETVFGDKAIAVHSEDPRYTSFVNHKASNPMTNEMIPIIQDDTLVNSLEGCGAVKITPGHDMNDYECGLRHNLSVVNIMDKKGRMNNYCGSYEGMDRFDCRRQLLEELKSKHMLIDIQEHTMKIPICSRTGDILEPTVLDQWFLRTSKMTSALSSMNVSITPELYTSEWSSWLANCKDWCISRQLYWGHRIPAYKVIPTTSSSSLLNQKQSSNSDIDIHNDCKEYWCVASSEELAKQQAIDKYHFKPGTFKLQQDEDVLDTWFSSSLLPLSATHTKVNSESSHTVKAKNPIHDINTITELSNMNVKSSSSLYPLSILETGNDILFFWVMRMGFMCNYISGTFPFKDIVLHSTIRDSSGRKMSKSRGNVIYPEYIINGISLESMLKNIDTSNLSDKEKVMEKALMKKNYPKGIPSMGIDALRGGLLKVSNQIGGIYVSLDSFTTIRDFQIKLFNGFRYIKNAKFNTSCTILNDESMYNSINESGSLIEKWLWNDLNNTISCVRTNMNSYKYSQALDAIRHFYYDSYCDKFIEFSKLSLQKQSSDAQRIYTFLQYAYVKTLQLLHPFLPCITESLYHDIMPIQSFNEYKSILTTSYPEVHFSFDTTSIQQTETLFNIIKNIRGFSLLAAPLSIDTTECSICIPKNQNHYYELYNNNQKIIETFTHKKIKLIQDDLPMNLFKKVYEDTHCTLSFPLQNISTNSVIHKLNSLSSEYLNQIEKKIKKIVVLEEQYNSPMYQAKAPADKQKEMKDQIDRLQKTVDNQRELLRVFEQIINGFNHDNDNIHY